MVLTPERFLNFLQLALERVKVVLRQPDLVRIAGAGRAARAGANPGRSGSRGGGAWRAWR